MASSIRPSYLDLRRAKRVAVLVPMATVHRKAVVPQVNRRATEIADPMVNRHAMEIASRMPGRAVRAKASRRAMEIANRKRIVLAMEKLVPMRGKRVAHRVAMAKATSRATRKRASKQT